MLLGCHKGLLVVIVFLRPNNVEFVSSRSRGSLIFDFMSIEAALDVMPVVFHDDARKASDSLCPVREAAARMIRL